MDAQLQDIRQNVTLSTMKVLRKSIIDCAKNIKSNDETFNISTLPRVKDKLIQLMDDYVDTVKKIEACQNVFLKLNEEIEAIENDENNKDCVELQLVTNKFNAMIAETCQNITTEETEAQFDLEEMLRPNDDEIQQVSEPAQVPKDPITKQNIRVAVRSTICGHVYDKESMEDYIKKKEKARKQVQCPVAGCTNRSMKRIELVPDEEINKLIQSL